MPDWTERLTEKERTDLHETDYESATTTELQDLHLSALRTVAVLRELVAEKDKALALEHGSESSVTEYSFKMHNRCYCEDGPQPHGCHNCDALRLTEDDMRKRLEEKQ